jgi:hypothetical protein
MTKVTIIYDDEPVAWLDLSEVPLVGELIRLDRISFVVRYRTHELKPSFNINKSNYTGRSPNDFQQTVVLVVDHTGPKPTEHELKMLNI